MLPFLGGAYSLTQHKRLLRQRNHSLDLVLSTFALKLAAIGWIRYAACRISQQNLNKMVLNLVFAPAYALSQTLCCIGGPTSLTRKLTSAIGLFRQQQKACDNRACSCQILLYYLNNFFFLFLIPKFSSYSSPQITACPSFCLSQTSNKTQGLSSQTKASVAKSA